VGVRLSSRARTLTAGCAFAGLLATVAACGGDDGPRSARTASPSGAADVPADLRVAESETREDSYYPEAGDPLVDALHYHLDLAWTPDERALAAVETLTFRATDDADRVELDFSDALDIETLTIDGEDADFQHEDDDLVVEHAVRADEQYEVVIGYAGTPEPAEAPTERADFGGGVGWQITDGGEVWTVQEPYGAFTWYAVNDQPADKALYDFTLTVPEPWTGVANGELTDSTDSDGLRTTTWHLAEPASSYLVTVAFADHTLTEQKSDSGVPITIWSLTDDPGSIGETEYAAEAMTWLEDLLGPYPFDTFGIVINRGETGMETQTMVTLGNSAYATSRPVLIHELAHHWYGDTVSPADWSDVWMNEGMAMYLQWMWEAEQIGEPVDRYIRSYLPEDQSLRAAHGPPAAYDASNFGQSNIYFIPAFMWQELRERLGDEEFFAMVRAWPEQHENTAEDRSYYLDWIEEFTGEELTSFFDAWLLGDSTPPT
jgi:aminopeptidase N